MAHVAWSRLHRRSAPAWIWDPRARRIVWANAAGLAFWNEPTQRDLFARRFGLRSPLVEALAAVAGRVLGGATERVRLPLHDGAAPVERLCEACEIELGDGRLGVALTILSDDEAEAERERLRRMFRDAPVALELLSAEGAPLLANRMAEDLFGETGDQALAERDVDPALAAQALRTATIEGFFGATRRLATASGPRRLRVALQRLHDPQTSATALMAAYDEAPPEPSDEERALELLGPAARESAVGFAVVDLDAGELLAANEAARVWMATTADGASLADAFPRDRDALQAALDALSEDPDAPIDLALHPASARLDGPWLRAELRSLEIDGRALGGLCLVDLGAERRSLLRLKLSEDERRAAFDALEVGALFIDSEGRVVSAAAAAARLLGAKPAGLAGRFLAERVAGVEGRRLKAYLREGPVAAGRRFEAGVDVLLRGLDGVERPARLAIAPPNAGNRNRRAVAVSARPIVARSEPTPSETPADDDTLRLAGLARLSHGLRVPLTTIKGYAELLRDASPVEDPAARRERIAAIAAAADLLAGRLDALFEEQAMEGRASAAVRVRAPTALAPLIRAALERIHAESEARFEFENQADDALADVAPAALSEALDVLLRRALARSPSRPPMLRLTLEAGAPRLELLDRTLDGTPGADAGRRHGPTSDDPAERVRLRLAEVLLGTAGVALREHGGPVERERLELRFEPARAG